MSYNYQIPRLAFASLVAGSALGCGGASTSDKINSVAHTTCDLLDCEFDLTASEESECVSDFKAEANDELAAQRDDGYSTACINASLDYANCAIGLELKSCNDVAYDEYSCEDEFDRYYDICDL